MRGMSKALKPVVVIILAVAVAAGAAVYFSRQPDPPSEVKPHPVEKYRRSRDISMRKRAIDTSYPVP